MLGSGLFEISDSTCGKKSRICLPDKPPYIE
jgi:hypothetical protein